MPALLQRQTVIRLLLPAFNVKLVKAMMYKFFLLAIHFSGLCLFLHGQPVSVPLGISARDKIMQNNLTNWSQQITISDVNGRPVENRYEGINGTPYFSADPKFAAVILKQGKKFSNSKTWINLVTQELVFATGNGQLAVTEPGVVKEVSYTDTSAQGIQLYVFQTGFPPVDKQTEKNFYQLLLSGRCTLLRSMVKKVVEIKNELSGEQYREFETIENTYLYLNGEMKRVKRDKTYLFHVLSDKQESVSKFMEEHKINLKDPEQFMAVLKYYNSL